MISINEKKIDFVFRVDANLVIGTGHLIRCLTLALILKKRKYTICFVSSFLDNNLFKYINKQGFYCKIFSKKNFNKSAFHQFKTKNNKIFQINDARNTLKIIENYNCRWIIVDHYSLDITWENFIKKRINKLMIIDDLANRKHNCDILLDQNFYENLKKRYSNLVPKKCNLLLGPEYLLRRSEFEKFKVKNKNIKKVVKNILIFFGGADKKNNTKKIIALLSSLKLLNINVNIIVGSINPFHKEIKLLCIKKKFNYYYNTNKISHHMYSSDLFIGSAGSTIWELFYLGVPSMVFITHTNQSRCIQNLHSMGALINLGSDKKNINNLVNQKKIKSLLFNIKKRQELSKNSIDIIKKNNIKKLIKLLN